MWVAVVSVVSLLACGGAQIHGSQPLSQGEYREMACGALHYRILYTDISHDALYIGAMDRVFRLNMSNVSATNCERDALRLDPSDVQTCVSKGKSEQFECRNHIRVIQPMDEDKLYVCGTNAHSPKDWVIYRNLTGLARHEYVAGVGLGVAKCPYDPADNSTAVWVQHGNPGGLPALYSGTNAEFTSADPVIFRTDLHNLTTGRREFSFKRTLKYDSKWLDKPNFVGSFDVGEYVLFFFRETAVEYMNCGKAVYSRVARVCKTDTGGKHILSQNWATFLKARLNCSIPGEFPFYFNEIQSVTRAESEESVFYATFATSGAGAAGSAVCSFALRDVHAAFDGKFKEQASSSAAWLPVPSARVPAPRPGACVPDTAALPDTVLNFIRSHPLMDSCVPHEHSTPLYVVRDTLLTHLAVDRVRGYIVFYAATGAGDILKVVGRGAGRSVLLDVLPGAPAEPVLSLSVSARHGALYASSTGRVRQLRLAGCARHAACALCVKDPYCGWHQHDARCRRYAPGMLQEIGGERSGACDAAAERRHVSAVWGQSVHLAAPAPAHPHQRLEWTHRPAHRSTSTPILFTGDKYVETARRGLVVVSLAAADAGVYECRAGGALLAAYNVTVDAHTCAPPHRSAQYHAVYSHWCRELHNYKAAIDAWRRDHRQCVLSHNHTDTSAHPNEIV